MSYLKEFLCNRKKVRIQIDSEADESVFGEIFSEREYKVLEPAIVSAAWPILDIGAHVGMFTVYARCFNENVRVLAFEPEERNFAAIKHNFRANGVRDVVVKNVAVAGSVGVRELFISPDSHNHSLMSGAQGVGEDVEAYEKMAETFSKSANLSKIRKVSTTTLEQIFLKNRLERVSLVKMDCEGAEFEILGGVSAEILARTDCFYIEYHKFGPEMNPLILRRILEKAGFKVEMKESFYDKRFGFIWARK